MFPVERHATLDTIARGAMGHTIPAESISLSNLLDEESLDRIAESAGQKLWQGFITFGSASAGILAIFMIFRFVKLIIDTLIHGYALHSIYGWSAHLLGAIWSSVTNLLLHMGRPIPKGPIQRAKDYVILSTITSDPPHLEDHATEVISARTQVDDKSANRIRNGSPLRRAPQVPQQAPAPVPEPQ